MRKSARCLSAAFIPALLQSPAFFLSCSQKEPAPGHIRIETKAAPLPDALDLFFFDTLGRGNLDAFQQVPIISGTVYGISGTGPKRLVALSALQERRRSWLDIACYSDLCRHSFRLADDSPERPFLYGEALLQGGLSREVSLPLKPLLCQITIHSLSADFSGRPYAGESFICTRMYLTYAGAEYRPLGGGGTLSCLNLGEVDSVSVMQLQRPEMLLQEGLGAVGPQRQYPQRNFYCYPSSLSPGIHLVLEGTIGAALCYYPIALPPLSPAETCRLEVTLKRMGTDSPDTPAGSDAAEVDILTQPWVTAEPKTETF